MITTSQTDTSHTSGGRARAAVARWRSDRGFSLMEMIMVTLITGTLAGIAIGVMPGVVRSMKGDSITQQLNAFLRQTREQAIAQRRNIQIAEVDESTIGTTIVNVAGSEDDPATTELSEVQFEGGFELMRFDDQPDTPDLFGGNGAFVFSGPGPHSFTSEGSFVDANGDPANGTVFIGRTDEPTSAAAITIFGPTAQLRTWKWNGAGWAQ